MIGNKINNAGKRVMSVISATIKVIADIIPNCAVGMKVDIVITRKPDTKTIVEVSIASPVVSIVLDIASSILEALFRSCQNLNKKWSESSTAIPRQIENVIAIGGLIGIPAKPRYPAANIIGIRFGSILTRPIRADKNKRLMTILIKMKASPKPLNRSAIR